MGGVGSGRRPTGRSKAPKTTRPKKHGAMGGAAYAARIKRLEKIWKHVTH